MSRNLHSLIRDLQRRKARERRGLVVAEGLRLVADLLASGAAVRGLVVADDVADGPASAVLERARAQGIAAEVTPRRDFDALANTETPTGVMAVVAWRPFALDELPPVHIGRDRLLALDGVQDPGNVGAMVRSAHALGARCTVALDGTADVRSAKVVRGSMGSLFRHPVATATFDEFVAWGKHEGYEFWLAMAASEPVTAMEPGAKVALVVGSEGAGVREEWLTVPRRLVAVPMPGDAESLNAAVAAGILLHELNRAAR
jgi:TrmH family RNA methyltransferase